MNNVINLHKESKIEFPDDLMTFTSFADKHDTSKSYLYKLYYAGKIKRYKKGYWKISEKEVLKAM